MINLKNQSYDVFLISFGFTIILFCIFLCFRGFGWDGDSIVSSAQFVRLINPSIYGLNDFGTQPKILTILLFGVVYQFTGSFHVLTILSIILNGVMVASLCNWIDKEGGLCWLGLLGWVINIPWFMIVINCDNPAFSVPFIFLGLLAYFYLNKKKVGVGLLCMSSLFRPGAEIILITLLAIELIRKNHDKGLWLILILTLSLSLTNTYWGYLWAYPTKEQFITLCVTFFKEAQSQIGQYRYSITSIFPIIQSVIKQYATLNNLVILPFSIGGLYKIIKSKNRIVAVALAPLATLILPIGTFFYGTINNTAPEKHMEFVLILPVFMAFFFGKDIQFSIKKITLGVIVFILILFTGISGVILHGNYEVGEKNGGDWYQLPASTSSIINTSFSTSLPYRALISRKDMIYFILDYGRRAKSINLLEETDLQKVQKTYYDLILLPPQTESTFFDENSYHSIAIDSAHTLWIKNEYSPNK